MRRLIALALVALFVADRWDYRDLKNQTIVTGISVDSAEDGQVLTTFEMANIPGDKNQPIERIVLSNASVTALDATYNVTSDLSHSVYTGHAWLFLLSEEVARQGIGNFITMITGHPEYYMATDVAVVRDVPAREVFGCETVSSAFVSFELNSRFKTDNSNAGRTHQMYAYQIYPFLKNPHSGYLIPAVSIVEKNGEKFAESDGSAIFSQDRLVDFLSPAETQMYRIATGDLRQTDLSVSVEGEPTSLTVENCDTKLSVKWNGDRPVFTMKVNLKVSTALLLKREKTMQVEECVRQTVENGIHSLLADAQALRCDYFGFAELLHRRHLPRWNKIKQDWAEFFGAVPCAIEVRVKLVH